MNCCYFGHIGVGDQFEDEGDQKADRCESQADEPLNYGQSSVSLSIIINDKKERKQPTRSTKMPFLQR